MKRGRNYWIGFAAGIFLTATVCFLRWIGFIQRHGCFDYAVVVGSVILIFIGLPGLVLAAKKEAVPAKKSDWIGYAVIFAVLLALAGIGYAITR